MLFKKEIKESLCVPQESITISHRYKKYNRYEGYGQEDDDDEELSVFSKNNTYECIIIMTNLTSKRKRLNLIYQVPNGSIPVKGTNHFNSEKISFNAY